MADEEKRAALSGSRVVRALRAFPDLHKFLLRRESCGPILEAMVERRIPMIVPIGKGVSWPNAYDLLREFPDLVCILSGMGTWGADRWFRPLLESYPHVHVEFSEYILDAGIEAFVESYGPERLLFGTGFPFYDHGGMMLALKHADIGDADRQAIAAGNMERLIANVDGQNIGGMQ